MTNPAATKSRINNIIMRLLQTSPLREQNPIRLPTFPKEPKERLDLSLPPGREHDYEVEMLPTITSPSLVSDFNHPQFSYPNRLVDYSDSESNSSYTLMDLDNLNNIHTDNHIFAVENIGSLVSITSILQSTNPLTLRSDEAEPQPSTSLQNNQSEVCMFMPSIEPYIDSEDSWQPPSLSSSDPEVGIIEEETSVGKRGYKKTRPLPKRLLKKKNRRAAVGKSVQPNPCLNKKCGNSCADKFSEEDRHKIFENYWGLGCDKRKKDFILTCVKAKPIGRKRASSNVRKISYDYFLNYNGQKVKICQQFLLKTLNISQMFLRYTVENANKTLNVSEKDQRTPEAHNKSAPEKVSQLKLYIEKLPAVPSHYCRNKSTKLYLPQEFESISNLYKLYIDYLKENNLITFLLSKRVFHSIFKSDFNIGFHLPKKDKCGFCEKFKNLPLESRNDFQETAEYKNHMTDKEKCKAMFLEDQKKSKAPDSIHLCLSFDLQKVLNTPHGKSVNLYYSRKYAYYNESIYESGTRSGYCYLWGETQGKRGCNEIVTVMFQYLNMLDVRGTHSVINLYADSCAGQNRNRAMIAMIFYFLKTATNIKEIKMTYLLPGHTMMPVDSIHSTIEKFVRNKTVWAPSEWPTMITNSRTNTTGYAVIVLNHKQFLDWKSFSQALIPTKFKISFNLLRVVSFQKNNPDIHFKYGFSDDSETYNINMDLIIRSRANSATVMRGPLQLYKEELKISAAKYKDLVDLCHRNIIPSRYHDEYLQMKHDGQVPDVLAQTDEEDSDDYS